MAVSTVPEPAAAGKSWKPNRTSCKAHGPAVAAPGMPLPGPRCSVLPWGSGSCSWCRILTGLHGTELTRPRLTSGTGQGSPRLTSPHLPVQGAGPDRPHLTPPAHTESVPLAPSQPLPAPHPLAGPRSARRPAAPGQRRSPAGLEGSEPPSPVPGRATGVVPPGASSGRARSRGGRALPGRRPCPARACATAQHSTAPPPGSGRGHGGAQGGFRRRVRNGQSHAGDWWGGGACADRQGLQPMGDQQGEASSPRWALREALWALGMCPEWGLRAGCLLAVLCLRDTRQCLQHLLLGVTSCSDAGSSCPAP